MERRFFSGTLVLALLLLHLSVQAAAGALTIGIISNVEIHEATIEGFKRGMLDQEYAEGGDIRYLYSGILQGDAAVIDAEIGRLVLQGVDILLSLTNEISLRAKEILGGSGIPILIAGSSRPVEEGLLESLGRPGGDITGVRVADNYAKTLEWLKAILPDARKVLVPYNPSDKVSVVALEGLDEKAARLGLELVCHPVRSVEEAVAIIENSPGDVAAVYRVPSPTLDSDSERLSRATIARKIPMVSSLPLDDAVLMTFTSDLYRAGKQAARMAKQIHNGAKPSDLPVETCDAELTVNLKTASIIGVHVPDEVLLQAKNIIRE